MFRSREQWMTLAVALAVTVLLTAVPPVRRLLDSLELGLFDLRMQTVDFKADPRIRVFGVDDKSVSETGGWSREAVERILANLASHDAAVVYLGMPPLKGGGGLAASSGLGERLVLDVGEPEEVQAARADLQPELDGRLRRVPLAVAGADGTVRPVAALVMFARLHGVDPAAIQYGPDHVQVGERRLPTDGQYRVWLHVQPLLSPELMAAGTFFVLPLDPLPVAGLADPASKVLASASGAAVVIGNQSNEAADEFQTARGHARRVDVDANLLDTLLSGFHLRQPAPLVQALAVLSLAVVLGLALPRLRLWPALAVAVAVLGGYAALNVILFTKGAWLDLAAPLAAGVAVTAAALALLWARSHRLLGQFLAADVADRVLADRQAAALGGQEKVCTIMFYSLPPYLKKDTGEDPDLQLRRRNEFTSMASEILVRHGGRVMDYQGDAQMVLFGAPRDLPNHAAAATAAALEIQEGSARVTSGWGLEDPALTRIHAGVCTGPLAVGFVGSEGHKEFAAIGDTTNVAARLYVAAMKMGIPVLVAGVSVDSAAGAIEAEPLPPVELKGKTQPVPVFRALSVRPEEAP